MKTCIFIVGDKGSGKSCLIRSITGIGQTRDHLWILRKKNGEMLPCLVQINSIGDENLKDITLDVFPRRIEVEHGVDHDAYEILICAVRRISVFDFKDLLIRSMKEFDHVSVAAIKRDYDGKPYATILIDKECKALSIPFLNIDLTKDYHPEAGRIRSDFFP
jgi:hypothetical protein